MIAQKIFSHAQQKPEKPALIEDGTVTSYGLFARMINAARASLSRQNLPKGQSAIVLGTSFRDQWTIVLALRAMGIDTVSVGGLKMARDLALRNVSAVIAPAQEVQHLDPNLARLVRVIPVPNDVFAPTPSSDIPAPGKGENGGYLVATSGTTGRYKKVFFGGAHEEDSVRWTVEAFDFNDETVFHGHNFPLWTGIGGRTISAVWYAGGTVIMTRQAGFEGFFEHRPNRAILTPAMLNDLIAAAGETGRPAYPAFELDVSGGFLPLSLATRVAKHITPKVNALYGSTEVTALMRARFKTAEDLHWLAEYRSHYEIVDDEGRAVAPGTEGELRIRLKPFDCHRYLDDEEATAKFFRDGYFYPGDLATRRDDGRIRILGRAEDVINLKGYKVPVAPVEDHIERTLGADTVCIFSEMDDEGENRVVVAVESNGTFTDEKLRSTIRGRPGFEDARFVVLKEFPRAESGMRKVNRRELRRLVT